MKKILVLVFILISIFTFSACGTKDKNPAYAEVTTSSGRSYLFASINDADGDRAVSAIYDAVKFDRNRIVLEDGETATIHFHCLACGHDEVEKIVGPFSKVFCCDCPEEVDDEGNCREYLAVISDAEKK